MTLFHSSSPAPVASQSRFARGVERRSLKRATGLLRRSDTYFKKALAMNDQWTDRVRARKGKRAPERIQSAAGKIGDTLHKARLLLLSGSNQLSPLLALLNRVETSLLRFGTGVCVGGLFGHSMGPKMTKAEAIQILEEIDAGIKSCQNCSSALSSTFRRRLMDLDDARAPREPREETKFHREASSGTDKISNFLDQVKTRGWKVTEGKKDDPAEEVVDLMAKSHDTVKKIGGTHTSLLPDDLELGLCKIPIVLIRETKFSDNVKRAIVESGLELVTVYGSYTAINGVYLLGIHRKLMAVDAKEAQPRKKGSDPVSDPYRNIPAKNGKKLDVIKFSALLPAVIGANPELQDVLADTVPFGNPVKEGHHYYMPLLPKVLGRLQTFSLGEWQPLLVDKTTKA